MTIPFNPKRLISGTIQNHFDSYMRAIFSPGNPPSSDHVQYIETRRAFFAGIHFQRMVFLEIADSPDLSDPITSEPTKLAELIDGKRQKEIQGFVAGVGENGR